MRRFRSRDAREAAAVQATAETDATLVARALKDPDAFSPIFDRYWDPVFRFCFYRMGDWHDAEDAASQVFVHALRGLSTYRGGVREGAFRSWLFAIAHNVVINAGEKQAIRRAEPLDAAGHLASRLPGPEEQAIVADDDRYLRSILLQVPDDQRELLELRLAGLSSAEIAEVLGRSPGSIRTAHSRAVANLRTLMNVDITSEEAHV